MMRFFLPFLLFFSATAAAQPLAGTEWVRISATRKDGSRILDRSGNPDRMIKFLFTADSMFASVGHLYIRPQTYSVGNGQIVVNGTPRFSIDSLSGMLLVVTELGNGKVPDELLNRYVLLNGDYQFDYAKQNGDLKLQGDSLIRCNNRFTPVYKSDLATVFLEWLPDNAPARTISGSLVLNPDASVRRIEFGTVAKFSKRELAEVRGLLQQTSGNWVLPPLPRPYLFEVAFEVIFSSGGDSRNVRLVLNEGFPPAPPALTDKQAAASDKYFRSGVEAFEKNEYARAAAEFERCLAIDEWNLTASYNLAVAYHKAGRPGDACAIWSKLRELGQKKAEVFVAEYCNK